MTKKWSSYILAYENQNLSGKVGKFAETLGNSSVSPRYSEERGEFEVGRKCIIGLWVIDVSGLDRPGPCSEYASSFIKDNHLFRTTELSHGITLFTEKFFI